MHKAAGEAKLDVEVGEVDGDAAAQALLVREKILNSQSKPIVIRCLPSFKHEQFQLSFALHVVAIPMEMASGLR